MPLEIVQGDITKMKVDAVVNAANRSLMMGGGVCGAIFRAAGVKALQAECDGIGYCRMGGAVITRGYALDAKYVIHTVGPVWQGGEYREEQILTASYTNSLNLALAHKLHSIAFPLISAGIFGYPAKEAIRVAVSAIRRFPHLHDMKVYLVLFDRETFELAEGI
ncbi:O-acetyl-ADP-ribose deacetylase [bioreactor metagenome]|uniref:O-acetyl-ADP-ribose deacetylase n=1 Tax=bioreactor metagenome TaxID=1076179 RepID=A0A644WZC6_9ZZZZ